jgi:hypothetical protein
MSKKNQTILGVVNRLAYYAVSRKKGKAVRRLSLLSEKK